MYCSKFKAWPSLCTNYLSFEMNLYPQWFYKQGMYVIPRSHHNSWTPIFGTVMPKKISCKWWQIHKTAAAESKMHKPIWVDVCDRGSDVSYEIRIRLTSAPFYYIYMYVHMYRQYHHEKGVDWQEQEQQVPSTRQVWTPKCYGELTKRKWGKNYTSLSGQILLTGWLGERSGYSYGYGSTCRLCLVGSRFRNVHWKLTFSLDFYD